MSFSAWGLLELILIRREEIWAQLFCHRVHEKPKESLIFEVVMDSASNWNEAGPTIGNNVSQKSHDLVIHFHEVATVSP